MPSYKQYSADLAPPFLQGANGIKWHNGFNQHLDDMLEDTKDGVKARFPDNAATAGDDLALGLIGTDSRLPRYPSESDVEYAERLKGRFTDHRRGGTEQVILDELAGLRFSNVVIMEYHDWPADAGDPNVHHSPGDWYDSTGVTPWWSRFWVYIGKYDAVNIPEGGILGTGTLGTMVLGFELDADVIAMAIDVVRRRKPAHALFVSVAFLTEGTPMDAVLGYGVLGTMVLGSSGSLPGVSVVTVNK